MIRGISELAWLDILHFRDARSGKARLVLCRPGVPFCGEVLQLLGRVVEFLLRLFHGELGGLGARIIHFRHGPLEVLRGGGGRFARIRFVALVKLMDRLGRVFLRILQRLVHRRREHVVGREQGLDALEDAGLSLGQGAVIGAGSEGIDRLRRGRGGRLGGIAGAGSGCGLRIGAGQATGLALSVPVLAIGRIGAMGRDWENAGAVLQAGFRCPLANCGWSAGLS